MVNRLAIHTLDTRRWVNQKNGTLDTTSLDSIVLYISLNGLKSFEDQNIIRALSMLEQITGQKAFIKKAESKYIGSTRKFIVTFAVTLRKTNMFNFLDYLVTVVLPQEVRRYGKFSFKGERSNFVIGLKDWAVLYGFRGEEIPGNLNIDIRCKSTEGIVDYLKLVKVPLV